MTLPNYNRGIARIVARTEAGDKHIGMAIVVGERHVMTCCHVLNDALNAVRQEQRDRRERTPPPEGTRFEVRFPSAAAATGVGVIDTWGLGQPTPRDVAVLALEADAPAEVGVAEFSPVGTPLQEPWLCSGWSDKEAERGANGEFGPRLPSTGHIQLNAKTGRAVLIEPGYSGAVVWSLTQNAFVGMIESEDSKKYENGAAYAIPTDLLKEVWPGLRLTVAPPPGPTRLIDLKKLPGQDDGVPFVGRRDEIDLLTTTFRSRNRTVVQLVADGGYGKSAIVSRWLEEIKREDYFGAPVVFGWSFQAQGTNQVATGLTFISYFRLLLDEYLDPPARKRFEEGDEAVKGAELGRLFARVGGIVVLDGTEPFQPPRGESGWIRDHGLREFVLQMLGEQARDPDHTRLMVITTRWEITPLTRLATVCATVPVRRLSDADGAEVLRRFHLRSHSPDGPPRRLRDPSHPEGGPVVDRLFLDAAVRFKGHPLTLNWAASYLLRFHDGNLREYERLPSAPVEADSNLAEHALAVMAAYDAMFTDPKATPRDRRCRQVLCLLGLFTRSVERRLLADLTDGVSIDGLTDELVAGNLNAALTDLREYRLIDFADGGEPVVETHPLLRQYFAAVLRTSSFQQRAGAAHKKLYDKFRTSQFRDGQLEAIAHGCKAGLAGEVFRSLYDKVFREGSTSPIVPARFEVYRDGGTHVLRKSVPAGPMLAAIVWFFKTTDDGRPDWGEFAGPVDDGSPTDPATLGRTEAHAVLNDTADLLGLTRGYGTKELERVLSKGLDLARHETTDCIERFRTLFLEWNSRLARADLTAALQRGREAEALANQPAMSSFPEAVTVSRTNQANALMFQGEFIEAERLFEDPDPTPPAPEASDDFRKMFAQDIHVARAGYAAWVRVLRGRFKDAARLANATIVYADKDGPPFTRACARHLAALAHRYRRDVRTVREVAETQQKLCDEFSVPVWNAGAALSLAWARAEEGKDRAAAITALTTATAFWESMVPKLARTQTIGLCVSALLAGGPGEVTDANRVEAERLLREAIDLGVVAGGEGFLLAESYRLSGRLRNLRGDPSEADQWYRRAIEVATRQGGRLFRLRAAVDLEAHRRGRPDHPESLHFLQAAWDDLPQDQLDDRVPEVSAARAALGR